MPVISETSFVEFRKNDSSLKLPPVQLLNIEQLESKQASLKETDLVILEKIDFETRKSLELTQSFSRFLISTNSQNEVEIKRLKNLLSFLSFFSSSESKKELNLESLLSISSFNLEFFSFSKSVSLKLILRAVTRVMTLIDGIDQALVKRLSLGIDEILRNAYEHGNFSIKSQDKTRLLEQGLFDEHILSLESQADRVFKEIYLKLSFTKERLISCVVKDQGSGFLWQELLADNLSTSSSNNKLHGRGIYIIKQSFDVVSYNGLGNEIYCEKRF